MLLDSAVGADAAGSRAGIATAETDAGQFVGAFAVGSAFGTAATFRTGRVAGQSGWAHAHRMSLRRDLADGVRSAWIRLAGSLRLRLASGVSISDVTALAVALFSIVGYIAVGVGSAGAGLTQD